MNLENFNSKAKEIVRKIKEMNNMKLSEVFSELEKGSTETYEAYYNSGTRVTMSRDGQFPNFQKFDHEGTPYEQQSRNGYFSGNCKFGLCWNPVKTSVTWQEAIQAWADGKTIRLKMPEWEQVWKPTNAISFNHCQVTQGSWYVED